MLAMAQGRRLVGWHHALLVVMIVLGLCAASAQIARGANHNVAMTCTAFNNTTGNLGTVQTGDTITITAKGTCSRTNPTFWDSSWFSWSGPTTAGSSISGVSTPTVLTVTATTAGTQQTRFDDGTSGNQFVIEVVIPTPGPNAPTGFTATAYNQAIRLDFTPGSTNGGTFGRWEYSTDNGTTWAYLQKPDSSGVYTAPPVLIKYVSSGGTATDQLTRARLSNGTAYTVKLRGFNVGSAAGPEATAGVITPTQTAPGAPTALVPTVASRSIGLAFKEPTYDGGLSVDDGGSAITGYEYSINSGFSWTATPTLTWQADPANTGAGRPEMTSFSISGLTNGTAYAVQLRAINAIGNGTASTASSVTPQPTPPDAPTGLSVTNGDGAATVSFTAGTDYGVPITNYEYQLSNSGTWIAFSPAVTSTPVTISGLTNGTSYPLKLRAISADGAGAASSSATLNPAGTPGNPTALTVSAGNASATLSFTDAALNGNTFYTYEYTTDGGTTWTEASCPMPPMYMPMPCSRSSTNPATLTITKQSAAPNNVLVNGTAYQVALRVKCGTSWPGTATAPTSTVAVVPAAAPNAPTALSATSGNGEATISFTAGSDGGSPITNYAYELDGNGTWIPLSPAVTASPVTITGLTNGTTYTVKLRAINAVGNGAASASGVSVSPQAVAPSAPTTPVATRGDASISVAFTAGANGGAPITNYEYELDGSGTWIAFSPAQTTSPVTISGLTNGTAHTVKVRAVNTVGSGAASSSTSSVTPAALPSAPTIAGATAGNGSASIAFTAGATGGSAITNYEYSTDNGSNWVTPSPAVTTSPLSITGLTGGTTYQVKLRAVNAVGSGAATTASSVTPTIGLPGAPTSLTLTAGVTSASIAFTAGSTGGAPITDYEVSTDGGTTWVSAGTTTSPITVSGLTGGTPYTIGLRAVNSAGAGAAQSGSVTPLAAPAPSAPSSGGSTSTPTPATGSGAGGTSSQPSRGAGSTTGAGSSGGTSGGSRGTTAGAVVVSTAPPVPWRPEPTQAQITAAFAGPLAPTGAVQLFPNAGTRAMALIGGAPSPIEVHIDTATDRLQLRGRNFRNDISAVDENGRRLPLSPTGQLTLEPGIGVHVSGFGYQPNSNVNVYRHSTPVLLGVVRTDAQGRYNAVLRLPPSTQAGDHTLESVGTDQDGTVRALALGVKVQPAAKTRTISTTLFFTPNVNRPGATARTELDALVARIPATATKVSVTVRARAYRISTQRNAMLFAKQRALITTALIKAHGLRGTYRSEWSAPSPEEARFLRIAAIQISYVVRP